jgi:nucleotide-binding universal stress UspA family protein
MICIRRILYATDFSTYANQAYFHAVELAQQHNAKLYVVHVCPIPVSLPIEGPDAFGRIPLDGEIQEDIEYWRQQLEQIQPLDDHIAVDHVLLEGDPADEIVRFAIDARIDLIVLGIHGRTRIERLLLGSVAEKVVREGPCSVLVAKLARRATPSQAESRPVAALAESGAASA